MTLEKKAKLQQSALEKALRVYDTEIASLPEGTLICRRNGSYTKFFRKNDASAVVTYIPKKQKELAAQLAYKTLLTKKRSRAKHELQAIESYLKKHDSSKESMPIMSYMSPGMRDLLAQSDSPLIEDVSSLKAELKEWRQASYNHCPHHPEALKVPVGGNTFVRSKSEAYIAAALTDHGIPFRYECELILGGNTYYPDFTIRHPDNGATFIWEHFGLIDNHDYASRALSKLRVFIENGYIPSVNLITTFESRNFPLDLSLVNDLIAHYFI